MACAICDLGQLARSDPDAAVATTLMIGATGRDIEGFKNMMCPDHRSAWVMLLLRGGWVLESAADREAPKLPRSET